MKRGTPPARQRHPFCSWIDAKKATMLGGRADRSGSQKPTAHPSLRNFRGFSLVFLFAPCPPAAAEGLGVGCEVVTMEAPPRVEFFFSPASRYSYLAASQMARLEAETGCTVDWRPVNGGDIRKLRRHDPFEGEPVSGQYDWSYRERDARLWGEYYGIRFREPPSHRFDFSLLARAATAAKRLGRAADYGWRICVAV
jgi:DSBA-like thioredoxin domain